MEHVVVCVAVKLPDGTHIMSNLILKEEDLTLVKLKAVMVEVAHSVHKELGELSQ